MAQAPDTVVPNSLNYTDIKPQAIENKIQLCRYQPTAMVTGAKGGDMIKFLLSGNGCLDPYSTYFQFIVQVDDLVLTRNADNTKDIGEVRWLDRSAHSFFQRIVIRSQGVELERIEHYDVIAAMINDMLYSPEQCSQHYWEAFPTHVWDGKTGGTTDYVNADTKQVEVDSSL